jgi:hypothetical protein
VASQRLKGSFRAPYTGEIRAWSGAHTPFRTVSRDGLRGDQDATAAGGRAISPPLPLVVGRSLQRRGQGQGLGGEDLVRWSVDLVERPRKSAPQEVL